MKILFVHQNFPGQVLHLAPELAKRGHDCRALTDVVNTRTSPIPVVKYKHDIQKVDAAATRLGRNYTTMSDRGVTVARAALQMRKQGYVPDVIFGHSGWGETLFLKEVWPEAKLVVYAEFYYKGRGADVGFDPEFSSASFDQIMIAQGVAKRIGDRRGGRDGSHLTDTPHAESGHVRGNGGMQKLYRRNVRCHRSEVIHHRAIDELSGFAVIAQFLVQRHLPDAGQSLPGRRPASFQRGTNPGKRNCTYS